MCQRYELKAVEPFEGRRVPLLGRGGLFFAQTTQ